MKKNRFSAGGRWLLFTGIASVLVSCGGTEERDASAGGPEGGSSSRAAEIVPGTTPADANQASDENGNLMARMLDEMERLTGVLTGVKDAESAEAAASYVMGYSERHGALAEQFAALSPAEQLAQSRPHMNRSMEVQMALQQQMTRIGLDPALKPIMDQAFQAMNRK